MKTKNVLVLAVFVFMFLCVSSAYGGTTFKLKCSSCEYEMDIESGGASDGWGMLTGYCYYCSNYVTFDIFCCWIVDFY